MFDFERFGGEKAVEVTIVRRQAQRAEDCRRDIFESHRHRTFAIAFYMTGNEIEAEKILTGTFVTAFSAAEEPSAHEVDAALVGQLRERFSLQVSAEPPTEDYEPAGSPDLSGRNIRRTDLEEAVQTLPEAERLLFLLHDVEGYAPAQIARLLDIPENQVNRSLLSARILLRRSLAANQEMTRAAA